MAIHPDAFGMWLEGHVRVAQLAEHRIGSPMAVGLYLAPA